MAASRIVLDEEVDTYQSQGPSPSWRTLLEEQAAERTRYERIGMTVPQQVRTVAIGVDTQPEPAAAEPPGQFASFVASSMHYLGSCLDQPYVEFAQDWRATAERAELALLSERIRARGLIISTPPLERPRHVHSLPALGLPYSTRAPGARP